METATSELWDWMEGQSKDAPERGLQELLVDVVGQIEAAMEAQKLSRAEVARRAGLHREFVSRVLNNPSNVTVATLVRLANAVSHKPVFTLTPQLAGCRLQGPADAAQEPKKRTATPPGRVPASAGGS